MSSSRELGPSPDGRHDDLLPEDLDGMTLHVPDDCRELEPDRAAWLAEGEEDEALDSDRDRWRWSGPLAPSRADRRAARRRGLSLTAGVVLAAMLVVAVSGAVGAWIVGPQAAAPPAAPLASAVPDPGQLGGLLPEDIVLQDGSTPVPAQSLRPSVIALVPPECEECAELLTTLQPDVGSFGVPLVAVAEPQQAAQLAALAEDLGASRLATLTDPTNGLRATYGLTGVTLLLVRNDGVVVDVVRNPTPDTHIEAALVELVPSSGIGA